MPGNIHPTFYSCLSQEDFLQMQHKYVQAIILTHVGASGLSTLASHVGVGKETKQFLFGGGKLRHKGTKSMISTCDLNPPGCRIWTLCTISLPPSQGNPESWNTGTRDCLFLLLVASCYRRFQPSPALLGESFSRAWGMHKEFDFPDTVLCLKSLLTQIKVLLSDLAETPWKAGWNTAWFSSSFSCQA